RLIFSLRHSDVLLYGNSMFLLLEQRGHSLNARRLFWNRSARGVALLRATRARVWRFTAHDGGFSSRLFLAAFFGFVRSSFFGRSLSLFLLGALVRPGRTGAGRRHGGIARLVRRFIGSFLLDRHIHILKQPDAFGVRLEEQTRGLAREV